MAIIRLILHSLENDPPILDYRAPNRTPQGLTLEYFQGGLRITLPTPPNPIPQQIVEFVGEFVGMCIAELAPYALIGFLLFGIGATFKLFRFYASLLSEDTPWQIYGIIGIGLVLSIVHMWKTIRDRRKPPEIELTSDKLSIRWIGIQSGKLAKFILPRSQIYDVKYAEHSGNLVIRCHGHEILESRPVSDPIILQWIAAELREALHLSKATTPE